MRNFILPIALAAILLTACSKEESVEQLEDQNIDSVYVLNQFNDSSFWESIVLDESQINTNNAHYNNNIPTGFITSGQYFPPSRDAMTITWTGTQNERGVYGRAELMQSTPNFSFHFILVTECVMVEGNKAVYAGIISEVRELSGNAPFIGVGWRFYFNVIDNGRIRNGIDQIANKSIFASPRSMSLCGVVLPNDVIWTSEGYSDVIEPGFVEVSN